MYNTTTTTIITTSTTAVLQSTLFEALFVQQSTKLGRGLWFFCLHVLEQVPDWVGNATENENMQPWLLMSNCMCFLMSLNCELNGHLLIY